MEFFGVTEPLEAGQFVNVGLNGFSLRRPFGVADYSRAYKSLTIIYRVQGKGTEFMSTLKAGNYAEVLTGLGNGFNYSGVKKPLLIGGGMGTAPIYYLAKKINESGIKPTVLLGFRSLKEAFYLEQFKKISNLVIATDDGSAGFKGNVLECIQTKNLAYDKYFACGPEIMLKNLAKFDGNGEISLEARMGCGFGACMGCSIKTKGGFGRVCKEGPVFKAEEVIFNE